MDSQDKGESKIRQRQESLARRVGEALDQLKPNEAKDCPDAEIIAAYVEQALAPAETARWEGHFASCVRCRNVLRVLAASSDAPLAEREVSHLGELLSKAHAPVAIDSKMAGTNRPSRAAWTTRWLAPAIGVGAVLVVWLAMRPPWRTTNQRSSQVLVAQAPKEELPQSAPPPAAEQALKDTQAQDQKAPVPEDSLAQALRPNSSANAPARVGAAPGAAADNVSPSASGAVTNPSTEKKELDSALRSREIAPASPPAPAAPQPQAKTGSNLAAGGNLQAEANSDAATNERAQNKQAGSAQAQAGEAAGGPILPGISPAPASRARQQQALAFRPAQASSILLKAPASSVVWRAGKAGSIERSTDGGKTWVSQMSPSEQDWLAGTAFSDMVCWLAGRKGAIAETVDGQRWDLITPPNQAVGAGGVQPDWIGITAFDALSATVTSADGRKFTTGDGGMTWQAQ